MALEVLLFIPILAFIFEWIDSSIGMGYGTSLTPILLLIGISPLEAVPALLISQSVAGLASGVFHRRFENIRLILKSGKNIKGKRFGMSKDLKIVLTLAFLGVIGSLIAVFLATTLPTRIVKTYIGGIILSLGIFLLANKPKKISFSWKKITGIGLISSFNKAISGGGYGPLVTSSLILSGSSVKSSIGCTTLVEGIISTTALLTYLLTYGIPNPMLTVALLIGVLPSAPLSALTIRKIGTKFDLTSLVGAAATLLGSLTLIKVLL